MKTSKEDFQLCARCGGHCCLTRPGIEAPDRFQSSGDMTASLREALSSGNWVLEEHLGIPYEPGTTSPDPALVIRYPRPATLQERQHPGFSPLPESGPCVFLAESGCQLPFEQRPRLCRELVPDICFECESPWGRREAALAWLPWQGTLSAALDRLLNPARTAR